MGLPELTPIILFGLLVVFAIILGGKAMDAAVEGRKMNNDK